MQLKRVLAEQFQYVRMIEKQRGTLIGSYWILLEVFGNGSWRWFLQSRRIIGDGAKRCEFDPVVT